MAKGGNFERDIAKYLTKWLTGKVKPYAYWRTPGSGSLATLSEENKDISGDIYPLKMEACFFTDRFNIECKKGYPKTNFHQHLKDNKNFEIRDFWEQCVVDANRANKHPMLIFAKKTFKPIVGIEDDKIDKFGLTNDRYVRLYFKKLPPVNFFDRDLFFKKVKPDMVRGIECQK
jgi:hypothetical protein